MSPQGDIAKRRRQTTIQPKPLRTGGTLENCRSRKPLGYPRRRPVPPSPRRNALPMAQTPHRPTSRPPPPLRPHHRPRLVQRTGGITLPWHTSKTAGTKPLSAPTRRPPSSETGLRRRNALPRSLHRPGRPRRNPRHSRTRRSARHKRFLPTCKPTSCVELTSALRPEGPPSSSTRPTGLLRQPPTRGRSNAWSTNCGCTSSHRWGTDHWRLFNQPPSERGHVAFRRRGWRRVTAEYCSTTCRPSSTRPSMTR